jgi:hypothetical protein
LSGFERERQRGEDEPLAARSPASTPAQPQVERLLALQTTAGNSAISRLLSRSRLLQRDGGGTAPPAAPANSNDAMLGMTRVAWETGVIQREKDAAAILGKPKVSKGEIAQAQGQIKEASTAAKSVATQFSTLDPNRVTRIFVHDNALIGEAREINMLLTKTTPSDLGDEITKQMVPSAEHALTDITAPLPAQPAQGAAPAAPPAAPAAPAPAAPAPATAPPSTEGS